MSEMVIIRPGYNFSLTVQFETRIGPMASFSITKSNSVMPVVRMLELPEEYQYVRVLDVFGSMNEDGVLEPHNFKYFSVVWEEYFFVQEYAMTIKEKDFNTSTFATLVRKVRKGVNLADQTLVSEWSISDRDVYKLCIAVLGETNIAKTKEEKVLKKTHGLTTHQTRAKSILKILGYTIGAVMTGGVAIPLYLLYKWLSNSDLDGKLVLFPNNYKIQKSYPKGYFRAMYELHTSNADSPKDSIGLSIQPTVDNERYVSDCPTCTMMEGRLGKQVLKCEHRKDSYFTFEMTRNQVAALRNKLKSSIEGKPESALTKSINNYAEALKIKDIKRTVRLESIMGSPGVGKSVMLRAFADQDRDLILAPFRKLQSDYVRVFDEFQKTEMDFNFKTMHKAMDCTNYDKVFVEEFSSFPLEILIPILDKVDCSTLYLVGDQYQTQVRGSEGGYIGDTVPIDNLSKHTLMMNFRLSQQAMAILNHHYPYGSYAVSDIGINFIVHDIKEVETKNWDFDIMNFASFTAESHEVDNNTVRSNQGASKDKFGLMVTATDTELVNNPGLFCVSISRAKKELHLFVDDSTPVDNFMRKIFYEKKDGLWGPNDLFLENYKNWSRPSVKTGLADDNSRPDLADKFFDSSSDESSVLIEHIDSGPGKVLKDSDYSEIHDYKPEPDFVENDQYIQLEPLNKVGDVLLTADVLRTIEDGLAKLEANRDAHVATRKLNIMLNNKLNEEKEKNQRLMAGRVYERAVTFVVGKDHFRLMVGDLTKFSDILDELVEQLNITYGKKTFRPEEICYEEPTFKKIYYNHNYIPAIHKKFYVKVKLLGGSITPQQSMFEVTQPNMRYDTLGQEAKVVLDRFATYIPHNYSVETVKLPEIEVDYRAMLGGYDSYTMADNFLGTFGAKFLKTRLNDTTASLIRNVPSNGKMSVDIFSPTNARGNLVDDYTTKYRMSAGEGLLYLGNDQFQTLQCAAYRYLRRKRNYKLDTVGVALANDIADQYFEEVVDKNKLRQNFDHYENFNRTNIYINAAISRNYEKRMLSEGETSLMDVRFHLKDIFKPTKTAVDIMKVGQGISAWSPEANLMFGSAIRLLNSMMSSSFKDNVIYNNMITEEELNDKLNKQLKLQPKSSVAGVTDGAEFDSMQNDFTQQIEKRFMHRMGFNKAFIDLYYKFRKNYKIISKNFSARCKTEKTSGEPGTLTFNSILSGAFTNYVLRGRGRFVLVKQGDDTTKHQSCLTLDKARLDKIQTYTNFKLKVSIGNTIEFCGKVMGQTAMVPAILRKLKKIAGHCFRDYKHFTEYQISLRDFMRTLNKIPLNELLGVNAALSKCHPMQILAMMSCIDSFSHINEEQFYSTFDLVQLEHRITGRRQQTHC